MKKIFSVITIISILFSGYSLYNGENDSNLTDMTLANVEALANYNEDTKSGRYRTVGCNGTSFRHWEQYCCSNDNYHNCPKTHSNPTCKVVYGCD